PHAAPRVQVLIELVAVVADALHHEGVDLGDWRAVEGNPAELRWDHRVDTAQARLRDHPRAALAGTGDVLGAEDPARAVADAETAWLTLARSRTDRQLRAPRRRRSRRSHQARHRSWAVPRPRAARRASRREPGRRTSDSARGRPGGRS